MRTRVLKSLTLLRFLAFIRGYKTPGKKGGLRSFLITMGVLPFIGISTGSAFKVASPYEAIYYSFLVLFSLVGFTALSGIFPALFEKNDAEILGSKPVHPSEYSLSILVFLFLVTLLESVAFSLGVIPFLLKARGPQSLIPYFISATVAGFYPVGISLLVYMLLLGERAGKKRKNILLYFQVVLTLLFILVILLREPLLGGEEKKSLIISSAIFRYLPFHTLTLMVERPGYFIENPITAGGVILLSLVIFYAVVKLITPQRIVSLDRGTGKKRSAIPFRLASFISADRKIKSIASLLIAYIMRDTRLKLSFIPGYTISLFYVIYFSIYREKPILSFGTVSYVITMAALMVGISLRYSTHYRASWIFYKSPVEMGKILDASSRVIIFVSALPIALLSLIALFLNFGFSPLSFIGFVYYFFLSLGIILLYLYLTPQIPLSTPVEESRSSPRYIVVFFLLAPLSAGLGVSGYIIATKIGIYLLALIALFFIIMDLAVYYSMRARFSKTKVYQM